MFYNKHILKLLSLSLVKTNLISYVRMCVCVPVFIYLLVIPGLVSSITLLACSILVVSYVYIFNERRQQCESRSDGSTALSIIINPGSIGIGLKWLGYIITNTILISGPSTREKMALLYVNNKGNIPASLCS